MTTEQIEKAKAQGSVAVLTLIENAGLGQRLVIARAMRNDTLLRRLVRCGMGYIMGSRHREAAFWILLSIRLGKESFEHDYVIALRRLRRAEKRSPKITMGLTMPSDNDHKKLMREHTNLYHEYASEFGYYQAQLSLFSSEVIPIEEIMQGIREELADEYLKHPTKEHLHKYLRYKLESDLDI